MGKTGIRLKGDWAGLRQMMNASGFQRRLKAEQVRFLNIVGGALKGLMVNKIVAEKAFAPNAALTTAMKGSSTPLVAEGDFVGSINHQVKGDKEVFIGVLKGTEVGSLAEVLHDGRSIKVTSKMRGFFIGLHNKNSKIMPLKASTKVIRIPARPFAKATHEDQRVQPFIKDNGGKMLKAALIGKKAAYTAAI